MESDRDRYYRMKVQEIQSAKSRQSDQEQAKTLLNVAGAILAVTLIMVMISPGVLFVTYLNEWMALELSAWVAWLAAIIFTGALVTAVHYQFKKTAVTVVFYLLLISITTTAAFYLPSKAGHENMVETALYLFTPLKDKVKQESSLIASPPNYSDEPEVELNTLQTNKAEVTEITPSKITSALAEKELGVISPSFDCNKQLNGIEQMICSQQSLAILDSELAESFKEALKTNDSVLLTLEQRSWLNLRDQCGDSQCIANAYQVRIAQLRDLIEPQSR